MRWSFAFVFFILLSGCSGPYSSGPVAAKESERPLAVRVQPAALESIPELITATGELLAEEAATISAKVPGRVEKLLVDLGSSVKQGQVLAELERDEYEVRVKQAEALVEQTRARLGISGQASDDVTPENTAMVRAAAASRKEATLIFANTSKLFKEGVVSRVDYEKGQVGVQAAEARYQGAIEEVAQLRAQLSERRAQVALTKQHLEDCTIRAPFAGAITRRNASLGEYLAVNAAVVMLVRQHPLRLRLEVPERQAARVRGGQRIDVRLEGTGGVRSGRVVRLSPAIEAQNRSLMIEGEIPNEDAILRPGSFAEATITVDPNARGFAVPAGAIVSFAGIERVFVVDGGTLDERVVRTGRRIGERVEVLSGLKPGDQVVREATDRMAKGQRVTVAGS
jgi:RND family efflux transporter MFP subunit